MDKDVKEYSNFDNLPPEIQAYADKPLSEVKPEEFKYWVEAKRLKEGYNMADMLAMTKMASHTYYNQLRHAKVPSDSVIQRVAKVFGESGELKQSDFGDGAPSIDTIIKVPYKPERHNQKIPEEYVDGITLAERDGRMSKNARRRMGTYSLEVLNDVYVDTIDIYGVPVKGRIRTTMRNTVVVEDEQGHRHVVHKENLGFHERFRSCVNIREIYDRLGVEELKERPIDRRYETSRGRLHEEYKED